MCRVYCSRRNSRQRNQSHNWVEHAVAGAVVAFYPPPARAARCQHRAFPTPGCFLIRFILLLQSLPRLRLAAAAAHHLRCLRGASGRVLFSSSFRRVSAAATSAAAFLASAAVGFLATGMLVIGRGRGGGLRWLSP